MATVFELSEPYRNHLVPAPTRRPGVCATCWTAVDPGFRRCYKAGAAKVAVAVLGRHFDRGYGSGETYYQQAKAQKFSWDGCCLDSPSAAGGRSSS